MLKGTIGLRAGIKGNGIVFPKFEFNPNKSGVDLMEIEGLDGNAISCTVHLASVDTRKEGRALAEQLTKDALDRLAVFHSIAIGPALVFEDRLSLLACTPGVLSAECGEFIITGEAVKFSIGIPAAQLRAELEQADPGGKLYFGLYRSARQSAGPVEEFVTLYNILLMMFGDKQTQVDEFIGRELPSVPQTRDPRPDGRRMETVFSRLRNELAHPRAAVSLQETKSEMANWVDKLAALTAQAIRAQP
jgi:hypothetical protein